MRPQAGSGSAGTVPRAWARLVSPLVLLALWQIASATGLLPPKILASPAAVARTALRLTLSGELPNGLAVSFLRVAAGFSVALLVGTAAALAAGLSRLGDLAIDPLVQMLKALPFLGLLPLFILWFGIGEGPKVGLVAFGAAIPVYLTLLGGIRDLDPRLVEVGRTLELGTAGVVRHVVIPGALPSLLVGVRYGLSVAWLSLVVGEQINAQSGIGAILANARDFLQTDVIVVCLVVYALMGLATDALVRLAEARLLAWRAPVTP